MKIKDKLISIKNDERLISARKEYGYLGYSFLLPALIMLAIYFTLGHKPIGNFSVLTLDLNAQYVYFYEALRDFVWGDSSLLYSFSRSLGGEFMGIYAYYIASPLSYIVALFPKSMMLFALLLIIVIKIGLCGLFFGFYLHKQSPNIDKSKILLFSTMYALSAYAITYQNNIMWLDGLFLLPLLTYSVERLVKEGRFKLYTVILALMMASHYYIGYMLCWYTLFCFFFTYFKEDSSSVNPTGEKLHFIKSFARIGVSTLIGIGMSAFIIGSAYYSLQFGKSEFSEPNWDFFARFDLFDLFGLFDLFDFFCDLLRGSFGKIKRRVGDVIIGRINALKLIEGEIVVAVRFFLCGNIHKLYAVVLFLVGKIVVRFFKRFFKLFFKLFFNLFVKLFFVLIEESYFLFDASLGNWHIHKSEFLVLHANGDQILVYLFDGFFDFFDFALSGARNMNSIPYANRILTFVQSV